MELKHKFSEVKSPLVKSSPLYLYSALYNIDCVKAALQCQQEISFSNERGQ